MEKLRKRELPSASLNGLYLAYAISCIGDRLWTFALVLILEYIGGIRLVCFSQLLEEMIIMAFGSIIGNWMDHHTRKRGIMTVLVINNANVAISAALLAVCITISDMNDNRDSHSLLWHILYVICIIFSMITCSLGCLASEMEKMAFTKDWIIVITKKDESSLSAANAWMKAIDLSSSVISPFTAGYIINSISYRFACMIFVIWNLISVFMEAYIIIKVYNTVPELATRELSFSPDEQTKVECCEKCPYFIRRTIGKWLTLFYIYYQQNVFPAAFGLTLLYMTVLGFDGIAIGYAKSQGLSALWLGILRSFGAAFGIIGAYLYSLIETHSSARKSGFIGLTAQHLALYICIVSIWLPGSPFDPITYFREITFATWWQQLQDSFTFVANKNQSETGSTDIDWSTWTSNGHSIISTFTLLMGIAVARLGLYMADLSISQIMQETVPERERNTVFGVQDSIAQFFSVFKDVLTIIVPDPRTFGILIITSKLFVFSGFLCFCYYLFTVADNKKEKTKLSNTDTQDNHIKKSGSTSMNEITKENVSRFLDMTPASGRDRKNSPTSLRPTN
ncbi:Ferroportin1 (FPN1) family protein [Acanthocheilonema viteae]